MLLTCGFLVFVKHAEGTVAELCAGVGFRVDAGDLVEFVGNEVGHERASALSKKENVILPLQKLRYILILTVKLWLHRLPQPQTQQPNVMHHLHSVLHHGLLLLRGKVCLSHLFVREPNGHEG